MIVELGHLALILAFLVAVVQMVVPMVGAARGWADWMRLAVPAAVVQFALTLAAFARADVGLRRLRLLGAAGGAELELGAADDLQARRHLGQPRGLDAALDAHPHALRRHGRGLGRQPAALACAPASSPSRRRSRSPSSASSSLTSNPFLRLAVPPPDGNDLNPLLQDPGLAFHPPFLYLGYVGLSMAYSFAIAALIEGRVDAAWARWVRPWTLLAWVFLTIGIAFGSIWAYYELGWGGWWFWDPVENVSFMPWLISARPPPLRDRGREARHAEELDDPPRHPRLLLLPRRRLHRPLGHHHQRPRLRRRPRARRLPPLDPRRLHRRLAARSTPGGRRLLRSDAVFAMVSRESGLVVNNLLLVTATLVVFFGTMWPLLAEVLTGRKVSVGPPFFNLAFTPLHDGARRRPAALRPPALEARQPRARHAPAPRAARARRRARRRWSGRCRPAARCSRPIGAALAAWLVLGAFADLAGRVRLGAGRRRRGAAPRRATCPAPTGARRWRTPASASRSGAIAAITAWAVEDIRAVRPGDRFAVAGYELRFDGEDATRAARTTPSSAPP